MKKHFTLFLTVLFTNLISSAQTPFLDMTSPAGLNHMGVNYGAAVADFDNDGWEDIFSLTQNNPCQLYRNNGDGTFTDIAAEAGVAFEGLAAAAAWADIDNDGWLDLMLGNREGDNLLYRNNGDGTFTDIAESAGVNVGEKVKAILFADVDMDGWIDIYVVRFFKENILYKNNGDLTFTDESDWANANDDGMSMGALFFDYDHDGDPDLYLTRDGNQSFILYQNLGNGKFVDVSFQSGTDIVAMGMGVDVADVNNDGWLDIYVTNLGANTLLINDGESGFFGPSFEEVAYQAGVENLGMGWGTIFLDADNDGFQDLYVANDSYFSPSPNQFYRNNGDLTFEPIGDEGPEASMEPSYGVVSTDVDNDGHIDLFVTNSNGDLGNQLFVNKYNNDNSWVKIKSIGTESNRAAIGAKITVEAGGTIQSDEIISGSSYSCQNSFIIHFGLGENELIDKLTIRWPNGLVEEFFELEVNTNYTFIEGEGILSSDDNDYREINLKVSPNPFTNHIDINLPQDLIGTVNIELYDSVGKLIYTQRDISSNGQSVRMDLSNVKLMSGFYLLKVNSEQFQQTFKLTKN